MTYDQLITRIAQGDMQALSELYDALYSPVFALVLSLVKNPNVAADLTQDTFLHVHSSAGRFRPNGNGSAWVLKIARNLALDYFRKHHREVNDTNLEYLASGDNLISQAEDRITLNDIMKALSPEEREVIVLKSQGYSHREIAEITETPEGTTRWRYSQALKRLRRDPSVVGGV